MSASLSFRERLGKGILLLDGAMGTLLHGKGVEIDSCFDALNLTQPGLVEEIHRSYLQAGAEVIETNTFGANHFNLAEHGLAGQVAEINRAGVEIARRAIQAQGRGYIAGSVGPLRVRLAPFGRVSAEHAREAFAEQITALRDAGADVIILETFSDLYEIQEAIKAAKGVDPELPLVAEVTFTRDDRTLLGDTPTHVAEFLAALGADVIGVNCSNGPAQIARVVRLMQVAAPDMLFSAIPNAGWPEYIGGRVMYPAGPDYFANYAVNMRERGIALVGGCCGTTPDHIAAMRTALDDPLRVGISMESALQVEVTEEEDVTTAPSELAQKLAKGRFIISVEMSPPKGIATEKVVRAAQMLREAGADVINVSDSPMARMRMSPWAVCHLLQHDVGLETVLHFPTRGRNLLRVQGDLLATHALGVRNLFVVMGDPTHIGDYPDAADNYDIVPSGLVRLIKANLNQGRDWGGNKIGQPTNFLVGCALNLSQTEIEREVKVLRKKLDGGADFLITQPIFEIETYDHFVEQYEKITRRKLEVPVLVGLLPLYNARHATFLHHEVPGISIPEGIMKRITEAGDQSPQEGVKIAQELAEGLAKRAGGIYLMPQFGRYDLVAEVIEAVRQPVIN
jgi:homocysteine S-methyltransferase